MSAAAYAVWVRARTGRTRRLSARAWWISILSVLLLTGVGLLPNAVRADPAPSWFVGDPGDPGAKAVFYLIVVAVIVLLGQWVVPRLSELAAFERITLVPRTPAADILVLPASLLQPHPLQGDLLARLDGLEDGCGPALLRDALCRHGHEPQWSWEVPAQILATIVQRTTVTPTHLLLLGSPGESGSASEIEGRRLGRAFRQCLGSSVTVSMLEVDFDDVDEIYRSVRAEIARLRPVVRARHHGREPRIVFDVTGGTVPVSIAGAMLTMNESHTFVYWAKDALLTFDVRVPRRREPLAA